MTTVAGVPFQDLWAWRCPGHSCKTRLVRDDERQLEREAVEHYTRAHGTPDHPTLFDVAPAGPPPLRAV